LFQKAALVSSADSVGSQLVCHWHTLTLEERKTCLQVAFLLAELTKVLLNYFRESNKAY
jgi:hypothetical protein